MLGCTLRPTKLHLPVSSTCSSKEESRVGDREINGLPDGGAYVSEAGSGRDAPTVCSRLQDRTWWQAWLLGAGRLPAMGELRSGWHISYQGDQQRGTPLTAPLMDKHTGRSVRLQGTGEAGTGPGGGVQRAAILNGLTPRAPRRRPGDPALVKDAGSG